ncbi:MAG: 16S rRNA (uracil(1498)-N(3))-methyltransferase [Alphaproteobacteria bacterium]|nr:16S rRNA (uracil(1498)-N(3))-methyltransferase [Alphaproteobacteria bacterium]
MKNIPRIYLNENLETGKSFSISKDTEHYLSRVMRTDEFLVFNNGQEFHAKLATQDNMPYALCLMPSGRLDPSNDLTLAFAPIKQSRLEEMLSMATQTGVRKLQPVITERVNEHRVKWDRVRKIIIESAEQSGRNSVPELAEPVKFDEFLSKTESREPKAELFFADERTVDNNASRLTPYVSRQNDTVVLIGPEGGFSEREFAALDNADATGISLGPTVLRAETAAVAAIAALSHKA